MVVAGDDPCVINVGTHTGSDAADRSLGPFMRI